MTVERALRLLAGFFVALSVLLGLYVNVNFLWFTCSLDSTCCSPASRTGAQ